MKKSHRNRKTTALTKKLNSKDVNLIEKYIRFLMKHSNLLIILAIIIVIIDLILKRSASFVVKNENLLYGIHIISKHFTFIFVVALFLIFSVVSIYGFIKDNEFKIFIFPTIVSLSNIIDRFTYGYVIDYLQFYFEPFKSWFNFFNLSDFFITIFVISFVIVLVIDLVLSFLHISSNRRKN